MKNVLLALLALLLALVPSAWAQAIQADPGQPVTVTVLIYYPNGTICKGCVVNWSSVTINYGSGGHYHSNVGGPRGKFLMTQNTTDSSGHASATWTSMTAMDSDGDFPIGYSGGYGVSACAPATSNGCVMAPITVSWPTLALANASTGWSKVGDSAHTVPVLNIPGQYALSIFTGQELNLIGQLYHTYSNGATVQVSRCSLHFGGIYDGNTGFPYWQNSYVAKAGEEHSFGTEFDFVPPMGSTLIQALANAINNTPNYQGLKGCTAYGAWTYLHVWCGEEE